MAAEKDRWSNGGAAEDYPLMSNMKLSVRFVPDGFFARNPALGRAVQEGKVP